MITKWKIKDANVTRVCGFAYSLMCMHEVCCCVTRWAEAALAWLRKPSVPVLVAIIVMVVSTIIVREDTTLSMARWRKHGRIFFYGGGGFSSCWI